MSIPDREFERAILHGAEACFSLRVIDDFGQPVAGANVYTLLGMNFREKANFVDGCTSTNGELRIAGKTTGNEIEFKISKNGYYSSSLSMSLITRPGKEKVRDGKWQPWGETIVMRLRKVHNPILQGDQLMSLRAPATNSWIGLDLKLADWVKPFGKGEISDVELNVLWDGLPPDKSKLCIYDMRVCGLKQWPSCVTLIWLHNAVVMKATPTSSTGFTVISSLSRFLILGSCMGR